MRKLELVKGRMTDDQPRPRRTVVSTERRFRYPAEEVWEVSEDGWRTEGAPRPEKSIRAN
jgi:hypothetical protein